jgi:hypothetical protein
LQQYNVFVYYNFTAEIYFAVLATERLCVTSLAVMYVHFYSMQGRLAFFCCPTDLQELGFMTQYEQKRPFKCENIGS